MNHTVFRRCLALGLSLWMCAVAQASTPAPSSAPAAHGAAHKPAAKKPRPKLLDVNSASKTELMTLPGISAADADHIMAGRPYRSKAELATRGVLNRGSYETIRTQVVARPARRGAAGAASR